MGCYAVPESIRKMKPAGTMVKNISGHYYVYEFKTTTEETGKRKTIMGKCIGSIQSDKGFLPNDNYSRDVEMTSLEFGQYAIVLANTQKTLQILQEFFHPVDALRIYCTAVIHFIHGFTYLTEVSRYYEMSYLSLKYPGLKLGYKALSSLYDDLGRRQTQVLAMEAALVNRSSHQMAIDGHVIGNVSGENDLSAKGYKFRQLGEAQVNLLMAYDVNTGVPLLSRVFEGALADKLSVKDLVNEVEIRDMLFIVDRGFYSASNLELFSQNGNSYIIPIPNSSRITKSAAADLFFTKRFVYKKEKKASVIEYRENVDGTSRVLVFRDLNEAAEEQANYLRYVELGHPSYTPEKFEEAKDLLGVTVLQTNLYDKTPQEIYELYKKRWKIETYFNYFKNTADYNALHLPDYYKTQGLAFIMLVEALVYHDFQEELKASEVKGKTIRDCLLDARFIKIHKRNDAWQICNTKRSVITLFNQLHTPMAVDAAPT